MKELTQSRLKELFKYNPETGLFTWVKETKLRAKRGNIAGYVETTGYIRIWIDEKIHHAHRLAWLYMYGKFPKEQIDHINHERSDNRIINIREVTIRENGKNQSMSPRNTSGVVGVHWHKARKRWLARIKVDGKSYELGAFTEFSDAVNARKNAEVLYGFHENHGK